MNIAGRASRYIGSRGIATTSALGAAIALALLAFAPDLPLLVLALVLFGAGSGAMEITMNMQGAEIEQAYARPIFNSFHAYFSVGGLAGAILGNILAALNISPEFHFLGVTVITCVCIVWSSRFLLAPRPEQYNAEHQTEKTRTSHFSLSLLMLGTIAFCALLSVGAMFDWSALYLSGTIHKGATLAATGFAIFLLCMTFGRGIGDSLASRFGAPMLVRLAGALAAIGLTLALVWDWTPIVILGLGLVGLGLSVPFPLTLSAAGQIPRSGEGSALTIVTTFGYLGLLFGPAAIGFIADRVGLRWALVLIVLLCVLIAFCAPATKGTIAGDNKTGEGTCES